MALPFSVESLDNVPENLRELYAETDNGYRLNVDGYEDPSNLKSALQKEREAAKKYSRELEGWKKTGKSPDEIADLLLQAEKADEDKAKNAGEWDKLKDQLMEKHNRELSTREEALKGMKSTLESYLVDAQAASAISEHKGVTQLLMPHVKAAVKVIDEDGQYKVRVVNDRGEPRINDKGEYMTINELVSEMRQSEVYGRAFESSAKAGSGANPAGGSSGGSSGIKSLADAKTPAEKAEYVRQKLKSQSR